MVSEVSKMIVVKFSQVNPNLRRVWPFGGIFCLRFLREGCSPAARLDEPPLLVTRIFTLLVKSLQ